jgi:4-carboxymuconolactone decarboxylase
MNISEAAKTNYQQFFPDFESGLKETDPELFEIVLNFAYGETFENSDLDPATRVKITLASTIALSAPEAYQNMVEAALHLNITPVEIREILYQTVPYLGLPKVLGFINLTNAVFKKHGIVLPLAPQATTTKETRQQKGLAQQKAIFGEVIDTMYEKSPEDQLHIQHFLSANCFGDYYTRNGLDLKTRELLTFIILISLTGVEGQVKAHIQGNLNVGRTKQYLLDAVTHLVPYIGYPRALNAIRALNEVSAV